MIKFFVDKENITGERIYIEDREDIKHLVKVLRARPGDEVIISDKERYEYVTEILQIGDMEVILGIRDCHEFATEPLTKVILYQGVPKASKLETVVQKTVELGINRIVPVFMARTVVSDKGNFSKKRDRLQKIADEAVKQCKRGIIPEVAEAISFTDMIGELKSEDYDKILVCYEDEKGYTIKDALRYDTDGTSLKKGSKVALVIGPEGGFEREEVEQILDEFHRKACAVTLGKTILRTETAGPAALAMIMYELEL
ncbi:MAG: 16S rRNA (uracil(1498)-N(3))-methyltransferase [Firmicutes bacterium]|nr:16S rRNA (uracil(1498)-N(3))-methyltransferase [Bacillota bacterium]